MQKEILFEQEKETKNTIRFQEITDANENPQIGSIYIQKKTLHEMNWKPGKNINILLTI